MPLRQGSNVYCCSGLPFVLTYLYSSYFTLVLILNFNTRVNVGCNFFSECSFVTAVHDYHSETAEDLSFCAGDKIKVVERINSDWLLGELNGKEGLFPVSFVESVPDSLPQHSTSNHKENNEPQVSFYLH